MRYDLIRRVLVVVVAGLLFPTTALYSNPQPDSTPTDRTDPAIAPVATTAVMTSHARVVRLSFVNGAVTVKRPGAAEAEPAQLNMPMAEGMEISTPAGGFAEVQFENGSTARLSANSQMLFQQLALDAAGDKLNGITLEQGIAGFHFLPERHDSYQVKIADSILVPFGNTEIHTAYADGKMEMQVLAGSVTISAHSNALTVGKGESLVYQPLAGSEAAKSHARVVRLSYVSGTVMLKRPGSAEEDNATLNTPIQEGFELSTSASSYAEVEFENGSSARLGENSILLFHELALDAKGNKLNGLTFEQGYTTFHFVPERNAPSATTRRGENGVIYFLPASQDVYHVKVADATVTASGKCEFRADLENQHLRLEVFHGMVDVATATQSLQLKEGKVCDYSPGNNELASNIRKGIVKDSWDRWTDERDKQVLLTERNEPVHPLGPGYGWSELNTFGEWVQLSGGRFGWSPYSRTGWSPYTNGRWEWYPGYGWTWISGEPWGWVTDHCGMWDFEASFGWYWMNPMAGCGLWEPALVTWYAGPGWVGWCPRPRPGTGAPSQSRPGPGGHPHPGHPPRGLVAVPTAAVQNRQMITPHVINQVPPTGLSMVERPPFGPGPRPVSAASLAAPGLGITNRGDATVASAPPASPPGGASAAGFTMHHGLAPSTILMGGNAAQESSLLGHSHSGHAPLRAFQGTTLGGVTTVHGSPGEFRGNAFGGGRHGGANSMGGPVITGPTTSHSFGGGSGAAIMSHGSSGGHSMGGGGNSGGAGHSGGYSGGASSGGGHSGGGGNSGGGGYSGGGGGGHSGGGGFSGGGGASSGGAGASAGGGGGGHH